MECPAGGNMNLARRIAGLLLFLTGLQWLVLVFIAESFFPGYSVNLNTLSDLAATVAPNSAVVQPSARLFNTAMIALGAAIIVSSLLIMLVYRKRCFIVFAAAFGIACILVGVFPPDTGAVHDFIALIAFIFGPVTAIAAYQVERGPLKFFSVAIGLGALVPVGMHLVLGDASPIRALMGPGGEERLIVYPLLVWVTGFGGYLMGTQGEERA
jgi:hypothetical membrane protein